MGETRFDPASYEGKPRQIPKSERALLQALLDAVEERLAAMTDGERRTLLAGCLNVSPANCAWDIYAMASIVYHSVSFDLGDEVPSDA